MEKIMYPLKDVAKALSVSYQWLDRRARDGRISIVWLGGKRMITANELERIKKEGVK